VARIIDPSETNIDQLHHQYIQAIEQLFNINKGKYGLENVELAII
jgi:Diacylglycerol acyltransferase